jgi:hypothetical protein
LYYWLCKHDYPAGFQVLCANCNLKKEMLRRRNILAERRAGQRTWDSVQPARPRESPEYYVQSRRGTNGQA